MWMCSHLLHAIMVLNTRHAAFQFNIDKMMETCSCVVATNVICPKAYNIDKNVAPLLDWSNHRMILIDINRASICKSIGFDLMLFLCCAHRKVRSRVTISNCH